MAKGKIDFKAAATKAVGNVAGGFAYTQFNKLAFMQKQANPKVKGLISALVGYIGIPMLADKLKLGNKGAQADLIAAAGEGMGLVGMFQLANAMKPGLVPSISGYEENPIGLITEEDEVSGYEDSPVDYASVATHNGVTM
jgi:hypothetical protein